MNKALWTAVLSLVVIIILAGLLFWLPGKTDTGTTDIKDSENAITSEETSSDIDTQADAPAPANAGAGDRVYENGIYVTVVYFTGAAFVPESVTVSPGEEVRFENKSNLTMDVGSRTEPVSSPYYASFNQPQAKGKGGTYQLSFTQPGIFAYANMTSNPQIVGTVFVK